MFLPQKRSKQVTSAKAKVVITLQYINININTPYTVNLHSDIQQLYLIKNILTFFKDCSGYCMKDRL